MRARSVGKLVINYGFSFVGFDKWLTIMLVDVGNRVGSFVALAALPPDMRKGSAFADGFQFVFGLCPLKRLALAA